MRSAQAAPTGAVARPAVPQGERPPLHSRATVRDNWCFLPWVVKAPGGAHAARVVHALLGDPVKWFLGPPGVPERGVQ